MAPQSSSMFGGIIQRYAQYAGLATLVWLLILGGLFLVWPPALGDGESLDGLRLATLLVVITLPTAVFWLAAYVASLAGLAQAESYRTEQSLAALRQMMPKAKPEAQKPAAAKPATPAPDGPAPRTQTQPAMAPVQQAFALGQVGDVSGGSISRTDLIVAMNFPDDEHDTAGFAALRKALRDPKAGQLIQAAQDVLTLLSQDGIYMDDLVPQDVPPEMWRRFAGGERGEGIAPLGAIHDERTLDFVSRRMREDMIFRDAVHHFLRNFDRVTAAVVPDTSDGMLEALTQTRSARAFMVLARASGTFS